MKKDSFQEFVMEQLAEIKGLHCRSMFGGHGLYQDEYFFGILHQGRIYFKTDDQTKKDYLERGMQAFRPNEKQTLKNYFEVPVDILEKSSDLVEWARKAIILAK